MLIYEYKCLGKNNVTVQDGVGERPAQMWSAMDYGPNGDVLPREVELILNALAKDHWEPVSLGYPYIFRRHVA